MIILDIVLISTVCIVAIIAVENINIPLVGFTAVAVAAASYLLWGFNPFSFLWENPILTLTYAVIWFGIGFLWAMFRWNLYCSDQRKYYNTQNAINPKADLEDFIPKASENVSQISAWVILWLPSAFWFMFSDMLQRLGNWIVEKTIKIFNAIANRHFADLQNPVIPPVAKPEVNPINLNGIGMNHLDQ